MFNSAPLAWTRFPNLLALEAERCHRQRCERTSARPEPSSYLQEVQPCCRSTVFIWKLCFSSLLTNTYTLCLYIYPVYLRNRAGFMQTAVVFLCFSHLWTHHKMFYINQGTCLPRSSYMWRDAHFNSLLKATRLIARLVKGNVTFCTARRKDTGRFCSVSLDSCSISFVLVLVGANSHMERRGL